MAFNAVLSGGPCDNSPHVLDVRPQVGDTIDCGGDTYKLLTMPGGVAGPYVFVDQGPNTPPPPPPPPVPAPAPPGDGSYSLVGSYPTVQVLSPTLVNDVIYCTIQTNPSGVVASRPVQQTVFDSGNGGVELTNFAHAIEQIMADSRIVAAVGDQSLDSGGLLADSVAFTVEYIDPVHAPYGATAQALVNVNMLDFSDALIGQTFLAEIRAEIDAVYANLKAAAGG